MKQLPAAFTQKGWVHELVQRDANRAIYRRGRRIQSTAPSPWHYEVFKVKIRPASVVQLDGALVEYPEAEHYPNDKEFGAIAWTVPTLERAKEIYAELAGWSIHPHPDSL